MAFVLIVKFEKSKIYILSYIYFYLILILVYLKNQKIINLLFNPILLILSRYYRKILYWIKRELYYKIYSINIFISYFKTVEKFWTLLFEHCILSKRKRDLRYSIPFVFEEYSEKCIANSHWKLMNSNYLA